MTMKRSRKQVETDSEESADQNFSDSEEQEVQKSVKKPKRPKPITVEELNRIEETQELYHSNLFRLQIEELLKEVKIKSNYQTFVNEWLEKFNKLIGRLVRIEPVPFEAIVNDDVTYPVVTKIQDLAKAQFEFIPPVTPARLIGAQRQGTNIGSKCLLVDILVQMPKEMCKKEDYLNERFHHKRAFYLHQLAKSMRNTKKLQKELRFFNFKNDPLKPVLVVIPPGEELNFLIHVGAEEDTFKLSRFSPSKNNVRGYMLAGEDDQLIAPTPHYNASILFDLLAEKSDQFLADMIDSSESIRDSIILLKVWLKQRQFDLGFYGFNGHLVTAYIAFLVKTGRVNHAMSSYQIIRLFWYNFIREKWDKEGISLCPVFSLDPNRPSLDEFHKHFEVVFVDSSGYLNLCANVSWNLYQRIKDECQSALKCLDNKSINSFQHLFMKKLPPYLQYDQILTLQNYNVVNRIVETYSSKEEQLDYIDSWYPKIRTLLLRILSQGLKQRVVSFVPITYTVEPWPITSAFYNKTICSFGLILNPENAFSIVDKGPQANEAESTEFRTFWGEKSELRRFKDGSITESCVWCPMDAPVGEKRLICKKICYYLLKRHFGVPEIALHYLADQFDVSIRTKNSPMNDTGEERTMECIRVFDHLSKELREVADIPLEVTAVLGIDSVFRYCDVEAPLKNASMANVGESVVFAANRTLNAVFQLAASGKWPSSLAAFRHLKSAFLIQIAKALRKKCEDAGVQTYADHLQVLLDGFVFNLHLVHPKEIKLVKEQTSDNRVTKVYKDNEESLQLELKANLLPKLTSSLHGLHSQYPSFGPAVTMAKRWLFSQLIDPCLWPEECTELIFAALFMRRDEMPPPNQPQTAFLRFLSYMAAFDWQTEMVVVNFNDDLPEEQLKELDARFTSNRSSLPPLCIVTSCDFGKHSVWSKRAPSLEILRRVTILTKNALQLIESNLLILSPKRIKPLFTPSFDGYNLIIHLQSSLLKSTCTIPVERFTKVKEATEAQKQMFAADFNVVRFYLDELREAYDDFALFFYDPCGGDRIAVLWKPKAMESKEFSSSSAAGRCLKKGKLTLNIDTIIQDFELIGKGFVKEIEILSDKIL